MKKTSAPKGFTINERRANSITWAALDAKRILEVSRDVADWADDDEPITERRFVCDCGAGVDCWVSPVTDPFDTEEEAIEAWNRRSQV